MTKRARRNHTGTFKAKVALSAIKGGRTLAELAQQFDVHPRRSPMLPIEIKRVDTGHPAGRDAHQEAGPNHQHRRVPSA